MSLELPDGLTSRPMAPDDAPAITELIAACELDLDGEVEIDLDDLVGNLVREGFDPERDAVLVLDGPALAGWAEVYGGRAEGQVRPEHRGRGIGTALLYWTEELARERGQTSVGQTVTDANEAAFELFRRNGYEPKWESWMLQIAFEDEPPPPPEPPEGIAIRPFEPGCDERATYELVEDAFNEWGDRGQTTYEQWLGYVSAHPSFAPSISRLAFDGDELVGAVICFDYANVEEGWVQQVATKVSHRHRGIARALLRSAFGAFYERGKTKTGLSTDSRTGALSLYERVGMHVRKSYTRFGKELGAET